MEFHLNEKKVRNMAVRMRQVFGNDHLSHSKALEVVAQTLGYKNWDTLSGLLKRAETPRFSLDKPVTLFVGAFSHDSWSKQPDWVKLTLDQAFIYTLLEMKSLCNDKDLDETSRSCLSGEWHRGEELRIQGDNLIVSRTAWWLQARPKHADHYVETRMLDIDMMLEALSKKTDNDYLAWRRDVLLYDTAGNIKEMLEQLVDAGELDESYLDEDN